MLQNAYILAKIGADTAENGRNFAEVLPKIGNYPTGPTTVTELSAGKPTAITPKSIQPRRTFQGLGYLLPTPLTSSLGQITICANLQLASAVWPTQRTVWSRPSSIFSVRYPSIRSPEFGGLNVT